MLRPCTSPRMSAGRQTESLRHGNNKVLYNKESLAYYLAMSERKKQIHRLASYAVIFFSIAALLTVITGFTEPPQADEGTGAHIFQLSIVALAPMILLFLATADWTRPLRSLRPLAISGGALVLAFGALYYLEHYRDPNYRTSTPGGSLAVIPRESRLRLCTNGCSWFSSALW